MQVRPYDLSAESLPDGDYVVHIEDGVVTWGAAVSPDLIVVVTGGSPGFLVDDNGDYIYAEAP